MTEKLNLDRKPTKLDMEILAYLEAGAWLSHVEVLNKFKSTQSRDHFWRLRKAGHPIKDTMFHYETKDGKKKKYKVYYLREPEFLQAGKKVENPYKKGTKAATDFAGEILANSKKSQITQASLFENASI